MRTLILMLMLLSPSLLLAQWKTNFTASYTGGYAHRQSGADILRSAPIHEPRLMLKFRNNQRRQLLQWQNRASVRHYFAGFLAHSIDFRSDFKYRLKVVPNRNRRKGHYYLTVLPQYRFNSFTRVTTSRLSYHEGGGTLMAEKVFRTSRRLYPKIGVAMQTRTRFYQKMNFSDTGDSLAIIDGTEDLEETANSGSTFLWQYFNGRVFGKLPISKTSFFKATVDLEQRIDMSAGVAGYTQVKTGLLYQWKNDNTLFRVNTSYAPRFYNGRFVKIEPDDIMDEDDEAFEDEALEDEADEDALPEQEPLRYQYLRAGLVVEQRIAGNFWGTASANFTQRFSNNAPEAKSFRTFTNYMVRVGVKWMF